MNSTVWVENVPLDQRGLVELKVNRTFFINVTSEEARRVVHQWLIDEVSSNIGAESPILVVADEPVWRVPAWLSFPRYGRLGEVGAVDVDVVTGKIRNLTQAKSKIENAADEFMQRFSLPLPSHRHTLPKIKPTVAAAPRLSLDEDDLLPKDEIAERQTTMD